MLRAGFLFESLAVSLGVTSATIIRHMTNGPVQSQAVVCPKCSSPSVQAVQVTKRSLAAAVLAQDLLGPAAGVVAGTSHVLTNVCLGCGCQWIPGTEYERQLRAIAGQLGPEAQRTELARIAAENAPIPSWLTRRQRQSS